MPRVTLESADGSGTPFSAEQCRELQAPYAQPLNDLIAVAPGLPDPTADGEGYPYTIVVSTPAARPSDARAECGVTWPPWGPQTQGLLIYRHMLPDPSFVQAIQNVPQPGAELDTMGDYYPRGEYLADPREFKAKGCAHH